MQNTFVQNTARCSNVTDLEHVLTCSHFEHMQNTFMQNTSEHIKCSNVTDLEHVLTCSHFEHMQNTFVQNTSRCSNVTDLEHVLTCSHFEHVQNTFVFSLRTRTCSISVTFEHINIMCSVCVFFSVPCVLHFLQCSKMCIATRLGIDVPAN